jgi:hypothetical protein
MRGKELKKFYKKKNRYPHKRIMATTLKKFTGQLYQLIDDICELFPSETEFKMWREGLDLMAKANPARLMESFIYYVMPLRERILSKNEDFFMGNDFKKTVNSAAGDDMSVLHGHLARLWKTSLTAEDKETIWKYFQVLVVLAERYIQEHLASGK